LLYFSFNQFKLRDVFYVLLPKLSPAQLEVFRNRFESTGFRVTSGRNLSATKEGTSLTVSPVGVCWSNRDMTDVVTPVVPRLVKEKETSSTSSVLERYCKIMRSEGEVLIRFSLRMESSGLWDALRAAGLSGLSPDECAVARFLLSQSSGECAVFTDFPTESSSVKRLGGKQYYESFVDVAEAGSCLRSSVHKSPRNAYLPRDGILRVKKFVPPSKAQLSAALNSVGDWCGYVCRPARPSTR